MSSVEIVNWFRSCFNVSIRVQYQTQHLTLYSIICHFPLLFTVSVVCGLRLAAGEIAGITTGKAFHLHDLHSPSSMSDESMPLLIILLFFKH